MLNPLQKGPFGPIHIPFTSFGNIDSMDLFGINEMIIFDFYNRNRKTYRKALDLGANIGLHSIVMARCGWDVRAFEPDHVHADHFRANLELNKVTADLHEAAISVTDQQRSFVRVLDNTTASHLADNGKLTYGHLDYVEVPCEIATPHFEWADLVKMDIEGSEADVIESIQKSAWQTTDCMLEVGSREMAGRIFLALHDDVNMFSQKTAWRKVQKPSDIPFHHSEGSLFITAKDVMP